MDAKHIWRAALGELQVALSPANFETWLRHTSLVDVDDTRFQIAVPNGFAKDWLDTRYRSLISQTLARIVGYSVTVEFVVRADSRGPRRDRRQRRRAGRAEPRRPGGADPRRRHGGRRDQHQRPLHLQQLHRRLGQPPCPCRRPFGRGAARPRLQPALPLRRGRPRQDAPDARHRERRHRPLPAQEGRLRDQREVHQRLHHEHPAGPDRRLPRPLPPDRPPPRR